MQIKGFCRITALLTSITIWVVLNGLALGCRESADPRSAYRLVYGGDMFLGRGLNEALFDDTLRDGIFGDTASLFQNADIALINGEGVVSQGGYFFDKGEPRPFMFRAHPSVIRVLKDAGIDIVTVGNNHACDYGQDALREMLHRLRKAGIDYTGGGLTVSDARRASFHKVGDITAAVIGADFTNAQRCSAVDNQPGVLSYDASFKTVSENTVVKDLTGVLKRARQSADLVFLTPHWGENGMDAPTEATRRLARRLIEAGFDGILGHSAHKFQGVELIDGKPVIYDAGNLIDDMGGARGMIWEMEFTAEGVTGLIGHPIRMSRNRTAVLDSQASAKVVRTLQDMSRPLGTAVFARDETARVYCRPGRTVSNKRIFLPKRPVPKQVQTAPNDLIRNKPPEDAIPARVVYANGITLVGYKLFADKLFVPKAAQVVELFFKADGPLQKSVQVQLEATLREGGGKNIDRHLPGDWLMPASLWPKGKVITDRKLFRLNFKPEGTIDFSFALFDGQFLLPIESSLLVQNDTRVLLGETAYVPGAERIYYYIHQIAEARKD